MNGFLLMPGGGMSTWIWKELEPMLKLKAITPIYRIRNNTLENRQKCTLQDCVDYHIELIKESGYEKVFVVGHSGAGAIAALIGKQIPEKIGALIYISGNIPKNHQSAIESLPFFLRNINKKAIIKNVTVESTPMKPKMKFIERIFCNESSSDVIEFVSKQVILSEPLCVATEKFDFTNYPELRQIFICLEKDRTQSIAQQKRMMSRFNIKECYHIESDHMVMLSKPKELADILNEISEK